jgi:hypothetical protein
MQPTCDKVNSATTLVETCPARRVVEATTRAQYSAKRRVCARPATDSDPVRRQGPERGSTGGGGRPRSFPSGPPLFVRCNARCRAVPVGPRSRQGAGRRAKSPHEAKPRTALMSSPRRRGPSRTRRRGQDTFRMGLSGAWHQPRPEGPGPTPGTRPAGSQKATAARATSGARHRTCPFVGSAGDAGR